MSQSDLASETVSASYISLVESDRRTPSIKAAKAIAGRLGVRLDELTAPPAQEPAPRLGLIGRLVSARSSQLAGDWAQARDELDALVRQAGKDEAGTGPVEVLWEARWELAVTLGHLGDQEARLDVLRVLLSDPMAEHAPLLQARVLGETARALRQAGRLSESISHAEQAVRITGDLEVAPTDHLAALVILVSAYVESGDWQRADALCTELLDEPDDTTPRHVRAEALWAAAGVRQLVGRPSDALDLLTRADALVDRGNDIGQRTRLIRARALAALAADEQAIAEELIGQLKAVTELLGSARDRFLQAALEAWAALRRGEPEHALRYAAAIEPEALSMSPLEQAWTAVVRARTRRAAGHPLEAEADYRLAADRYGQVGAYRLAMETWRELSASSGTEDPAADPHAVVMP